SRAGHATRVIRLLHYADLLFTALFFFSSRRRHTRLVSDWSSDVCSSDLGLACREKISSHPPFPIPMTGVSGLRLAARCAEGVGDSIDPACERGGIGRDGREQGVGGSELRRVDQSGRASGRGRGGG